MNVGEPEKLDSAPNCLFKRARKPRRGNIRGRRTHDDESDDEEKREREAADDESGNDENEVCLSGSYVAEVESQLPVCHVYYLTSIKPGNGVNEG